MLAHEWIELILFTGLLFFTAKPLGLYMDRVFDGQKTLLSPAIGWFENLCYKVIGVGPEEDQVWTKYAASLVIFSGVTFVFTYAILRLQTSLPMNPAGMGVISPHLSFNTAMSFVSNTNWQSYSGESTMSYFSQMVALTFQNFTSAAVGIAAAVAVVRGLSRKQGTGIGNFWADTIRANLYVLLPLCLVYAVFLLSQGVIQNFIAYPVAQTLEGAKQTIAMGPVASQVAIKMLGTNGGGFFNANAAHPFENPTALSNFVQMFSIFLIPSALVYLLGSKMKSFSHARAVWSAMAIVFLAGVFICNHYESVGNPAYAEAGCSTTHNLEGKEMRFGVFESALFATVTTDASCGAVNSMHDSFTPLGGLVPLVNIMLGEVIFGGVGSGLYGIVMYIILTVFIAGLMIGRTPEYMGKKIEGREVKYAMFALIIMALSILGFTAVAAVSDTAKVGLANPAEHGFSEMLYAFVSATGNNGSAFAGLSANTPFWNMSLAFAMFFGRFIMLIPMLALAGSMVKKKIHPGGEGTFPVDGPLFVFLLIGVIVIVGALTFFPALSLGSIAEHFDMLHAHFYK